MTVKFGTPGGSITKTRLEALSVAEQFLNNNQVHLRFINLANKTHF